MAVKAQSLQFVLTELAEQDRRTTRALSILIDGEPVWPMAGMPDAALEIQVDDLLAFLTEHWKPLLLRQTYPAGFNPYRPSLLRADASKRWNEVPAEIEEREEDAVLGFEEAHDLSHAFAGLFGLPSFWLLRSTETYQIETQKRLWHLPYDHVVDALTRIGDQSADLLRTAGVKWAPLVDAWSKKTEADGVELLAWATGIDVEESRVLIEDGTLTKPASFADAANDNDELRIAARMAGGLPVEQIREIIAIARSYRKIEADKLDSLAQDCLAQLDERWSTKPPYRQGEETARFVRDRMGFEADDVFDVLACLNRLGVVVQTADIEPETLDGLAIWGSNHGPGVFLNLASQRVSNARRQSVGDDPAARVTLAHELCHLLLDGGHAVTAVDVLESRMPLAIEQRAKSFAGELLLPSRTAVRWWEDGGSPPNRDGLKRVLSEIASAFNIPLAVANWKLEHGLQSRGIDLSGILGSLSRFR